MNSFSDSHSVPGRIVMAGELFAQRTERLVGERNAPALLVEAQHLLTLYLDGDDGIDLEPIVSAVRILEHVAAIGRTREDGR